MAVDDFGSMTGGFRGGFLAGRGHFRHFKGIPLYFVALAVELFP